MTYALLIGDVRKRLDELPANSVHNATTSPPYWALRSYLAADHPDKQFEIGSEPTPEEYIETMVDVFRRLRRVLRDDGTLWLNLGDSFYGGGRGGDSGSSTIQRGATNSKDASRGIRQPTAKGYKPGDLLNMPHRVAAALQADGWFWRATIIWAKRSPMPETVGGWEWRKCRKKVSAGATKRWAFDVGGNGSQAARKSGEHFLNEGTLAEWASCPGCEKCLPNGGLVLRRGKWRPTTSHEPVFLFSKSERYFCDAEAVQEPTTGGAHSRGKGVNPKAVDGETGVEKQNGSFSAAVRGLVETRNPRSVMWAPVWELSNEPYHGDHFAAFPSELARRCILAGTSPECCYACGAPYAPIVERDRVPTRPGNGSKIWKSDNYDVVGQRTPTSPNRNPERHVAVRRVLGYRPTCECGAASARCVVLDPFAGTGTTLQAARHLGRDSIGIELNDDSARQAEERINTVPRFALVKGAKRVKPAKNQMAMFE